jgi:hypothetical protein
MVLDADCIEAYRVHGPCALAFSLGLDREHSWRVVESCCSQQVLTIAAQGHGGKITCFQKVARHPGRRSDGVIVASVLQRVSGNVEVIDVPAGAGT